MKTKKLRLAVIAVALMLAMSFAMMTACGRSDSLRSITVTRQPSLVTYVEGVRFNPGGMEVTAELRDGTTFVVDGFTFSPNRPLATTDSVITISYTHNGTTRTTTVNITVRASLIETATRDRIREFIYNTINDGLPQEASEIANELITDVFGNLDALTDSFLNILSEAFLTDVEVNALLDLFESSSEGMLDILEGFGDIGITNDKIAAFVWATLATVDAFGTQLESAIMAQIPQDEIDYDIWIGTGVYFDAIREIVNLGANDVQLIIRAALDLGDIVDGAMDNILFIATAVDMPSRTEFIDLVSEMRKDILDALDILDTDAMRVFVNIAKIIAVPSVDLNIQAQIDWLREDIEWFQERVAQLEEQLETLKAEGAPDWQLGNVERDIEWRLSRIEEMEAQLEVMENLDISARDFFDVTNAFVSDWGYVRNSLIASANALNAAFAGEIFDAIYAEYEDMGIVVAARILNAGLTAPNGINNARANTLVQKYLELLDATGIFDMMPNDGPTIEELMELMDYFVDEFFSDVAIVATKGLNYTFGPEYDDNLFVMLFMGGRVYNPGGGWGNGDYTIVEPPRP